MKLIGLYSDTQRKLQPPESVVYDTPQGPREVTEVVPDIRTEYIAAWLTRFPDGRNLGEVGRCLQSAPIDTRRLQ